MKAKNKADARPVNSRSAGVLIETAARPIVMFVVDEVGQSSRATFRRCSTWASCSLGVGPRQALGRRHLTGEAELVSGLDDKKTTARLMDRFRSRFTWDLNIGGHEPPRT